MLVHIHLRRRKGGKGGGEEKEDSDNRLLYTNLRNGANLVDKDY